MPIPHRLFAQVRIFLESILESRFKNGQTVLLTADDFQCDQRGYIEQSEWGSNEFEALGVTVKRFPDALFVLVPQFVQRSRGEWRHKISCSPGFEITQATCEETISYDELVYSLDRWVNAVIDEIFAYPQSQAAQGLMRSEDVQLAQHLLAADNASEPFDVSELQGLRQRLDDQEDRLRKLMQGARLGDDCLEERLNELETRIKNLEALAAGGSSRSSVGLQLLEIIAWVMRIYGVAEASGAVGMIESSSN